jgi:hypothetical protein
MLNFFMAGPDRVRWELTQLESGGCRLAVHHARGVIVEYLASVPMALLRIQDLEETLTTARIALPVAIAGVPS